MCKSKNEVGQNFLICLRNFIKTTKLQQSAKCLGTGSCSSVNENLGGALELNWGSNEILGILN